MYYTGQSKTKSQSPNMLMGIWQPRTSGTNMKAWAKYLIIWQHTLRRGAGGGWRNRKRFCCQFLSKNDGMRSEGLFVRTRVFIYIEIGW